MFHRLGKLTAANPWIVCAIWLALGAGLTYLAPHWDTHAQDDDVKFVPNRFTSVRAHQLMEKAFPQEVEASRFVFAMERSDGPLSEADLQLVDRIVADLDDLKLGKVTSCKDGLLGYRMTSSDRRCTLIQVALDSPFMALKTVASVDRASERAHKQFNAAGIKNLQLYGTGAAGIGHDLTKACGDSLESTTWATVILVIVVLLLVYRAPLLALVPLMTIGVSVWVALKLLAFMTLIPGVHLVNISKIFAIVILYGAGTDYCLFLVSRYREELGDGHDMVDALVRSVGGVGEALAASAGTVMVGLGLMALAEFARVRYAGPAIALSLGVALLASLTLTPALLRLLGKAVFWPGKRPDKEATPAPVAGASAAPRPPANEMGLWDRVSRVVARHPVKVWLASVVVLAPLVILGLQVKPTYRATGDLPPQTESLQGLAAIQRHFTAGEIGPVTVLLSGTVDWTSREGQMEIDHLSRGFSELPNVAEVRSLTQPLGHPMFSLPTLDNPENLVQSLYVLVQPYVQGIIEYMRLQSRDFYVARISDEQGSEDAEQKKEPGTLYVARLDVVLKTDPFDGESAKTLRFIQTWLKSERPRTSFVNCEVTSECFGITANTQDLAELTESDRQRVNIFVLAAIFAILLLLVRRLWLAGYLLVTVLASYYAAMGATVLAGYFWTGAILPTIDWRVPFFLFTILVAVGEDYNILLVSRALQEQQRYGLVEGMRRALAKTGGAITSCGLIMAGTFATLMLAGLGTLLQIGFALAFGVLIDTFIVRPFLVPAFAILCWKAGAPAPKFASAASPVRIAKNTKPAAEAVSEPSDIPHAA